MPVTLKLVPQNENGVAPREVQPSREELRRAVHAHVAKVVDYATDANAPTTFKAFEQEVIPLVFTFGRLVMALYLCTRHERMAVAEETEIGGRVFERQSAVARNLHSNFGVLRYWRTYLRPKGQQGKADRGGFYPLDVALGLLSDRFSLHVLSLAARLATKLSFAQAHVTLCWFLTEAPSTEVIENTVLGLGRYTQEWFESAPAPKNDGDVLVIQIDGKAAPTATDSELLRRRGKRPPNPHPESARHRGRSKRKRHDKKPQRKKGDKSKNGKVATLVVMYTLRRSADGKQLLGPINRRVYGSFSNKRHAFEYARREADKRGFTQASGKQVQVLTDGDNDYAKLVHEFFAEAIHTIDVMHVVEYLWKAARKLFREGSEQLKDWVEEQKERLYDSRVQEIIADLKQRRDLVPATGPGNKKKRRRLESTINYLQKRVKQMDYRKLRKMDLELGTGSVEGAVKYVFGKRFDDGGMRWIPERAEPLLHLRCIDINGDWEAFIDFVHEKLQSNALATGRRVRLQQLSPPSLAQPKKAA